MVEKKHSHRVGGRARTARDARRVSRTVTGRGAGAGGELGRGAARFGVEAGPEPTPPSLPAGP